MREKAFTLVELLVVVAIVSILAAFMIPTMQNARQAACKVSCMNNLKQIDIAFREYEGEFRGYLPYPANILKDPDTGYFTTWVSVIAPYLGMSGKVPASYKLEGGIRGALRCPSYASYDHPKADEKFPKYPQNQTYSWSWSYGFDQLYSPKSWAVKRMSPPQGKSKENLIMLADGWNPKINTNIDPEITVFGVYLRHAGAANYLFQDGCIKSSNTLHLVDYREPPWR